MSDNPAYLEDRNLNEWEHFGEEPKGPEVVKAYIGKTREFSEHQMQVIQGQLTAARKRAGVLNYHVPVNMRGKYLVGDNGAQLGERVQNGYALCNAIRTKPHNSKNWKKENIGKPCMAKAMNHSGFCSNHGGALNPLDRKQVDWDRAPREVKWHYGKLPIDDLDDEELARGQLRREDGTFTEARFVPATMHDQMVKRLFERADQRMRENLLDVVDAMTEIAKSPVSEDADRLRAAEFIFKWLRGNQPVKVEIGMDKPFEKVMNAVLTGGSRSESRAARGIEDDEEYLDGEIVEDLDLPMLETSGTPDEEESSPIDEEDEQWDYTDPRDKNLHSDLEPKLPLHVGPAGRATTDRPSEPDQRATYNQRYAENVKESELRREKVFRKRMSPKEIADARKEKKQAIQKGLVKRKALRAQGFVGAPILAEITISRVMNSDGELVDLDEIHSEEDLFNDDYMVLSVDVSVLDKTAMAKVKMPK